jgi:hypothetical protein
MTQQKGEEGYLQFLCLKKIRSKIIVLLSFTLLNRILNVGLKDARLDGIAHGSF